MSLSRAALPLASCGASEPEQRQQGALLRADQQVACLPVLFALRRADLDDVLG
ncbi:MULTISPECIES: hypothetical protein [unclassified Nonomuraea]|uniref:hypothetical protein n=1 Tax=unclassified Nonomuraea TaxID=2593643 RepID=UPI0033E28E0D